MRYYGGSMLACAALAMTFSACATTGALRRAKEEQAQALANERVQREAADKQLRADLEAQLGKVRGDVVALRDELKAMRADFGAKIAMLENGLQFMMPVNFAFNDATVRPEDGPVLTRFAQIASKYYPGSKITIAGFADPAGSKQYNLMLSQRRATSVRNFLVARGLTTSPLQTVGYGESRQVAPGAWGNEPGAQDNRRVVFVIETRPTSSVASAGPPRVIGEFK